MRNFYWLLTTTAFAVPATAQNGPPAAAPEATPAQAQSAAPVESDDPAEDYGDGEEIVVTGARLPGSVVGDIPPEKTFDARDIRATGATNINELLEALAPETGSARGRGGGAPVVLLNGQRVSGFRELRDIPTEAIQRVEVLPEEVALKYGYRADQRVVNIVTRRRFRSPVAEARGTAATDGGYAGGIGDVTRLIINRTGRTTLNLRGEANGTLTEAERDIASETDDGFARSLIGSRRLVRGTATINRSLGDVSATLNTELQHSSGRSLIGLGETLLEPLARNTDSNSAHAGVTLNWDKADWRWNVTGNADLDRSVTRTDRDDAFDDDRARSTRRSADVTGTAHGNLFKLPAGDASTTIRVGASTVGLDSERRRAEVVTGTDLGRTQGNAAINLDLPISRRNRDFSALGNLTLNANLEVEQLSDFGTLATFGAGANWSPIDRLNLITSWTREEGAPSIQQLGDPILETPDARIFDFTTGETALVTAITGGNPDLLADRRSVFKLGGNWQPSEKVDLRLRADFVSSRIDRPIGSIATTSAIEAAFPERFVRDGAGQLVSVDLRPVNFDSARQDTLRLGFNFTKPLKSRQPTQAQIDQMRAQFGGGGRRGGQAGGAPAGGAPSADTARPQEGAAPREGGGGRGFGRGGRGFGGGGGPFGGGNRGRLQFSLTDTITLVDKVNIRAGVPQLDYLDGEAIGQTGGRPRHQVEARAGWFNNGLGARASLDWRSGTRVESLTGDDLRFSPYATFDLRLFANLGEQFALVRKNPWLRGSSVRLEVDNLFNSRPRVRDASGNVPLNYQPDLLEPLGRTVMISFRKLFTPSPAAMRRMREQERAAGQTPGGDED
ncbi:TonB-dependent receptor plug domain-containing protein [Sphingomonas lutea]|uniref:TonB-dependent receptor plug domain-containing protein n=1 Tax=Sphingomonas lutea TaxID=1045317 RepID=UPI0022857D46|nr:TonB-dependent receptor plug domain-containing protein [Sphingomonas lutea]